MANVYTNYKANLTSSASTTLYTVGSETTAIIKSIRVSNTNVNRNCKITLNLVDTDSTVYPLETNRDILKGSSMELLSTGTDSESGFTVRTGRAIGAVPVVLKESEVIKAVAEKPGDLTIIISVLEIS
tara:strand:- start:554 stop:937 length:384 start_codon:yes stop_codon:yes gene_type:complete